MDDLPPELFRRLDETPDELFYRQPRFVTHIDDAAIGAVTGLYREFFAPGARVLDLMSSWVSHLPPEVDYREVVGLGLNREELAANPRLTRFVVHNLNAHPALPFPDGSFGAAGITVSIDYLTAPVTVLRDLRRVLTPGSPVVITFSNRCFPTKAVLAWHHLDDAGRLKLVGRYLGEAGFTRILTVDRSPGRGNPLYGVIGWTPDPPGPLTRRVEPGLCPERPGETATRDLAALLPDGPDEASPSGVGRQFFCDIQGKAILSLVGRPGGVGARPGPARVKKPSAVLRATRPRAPGTQTSPGVPSASGSDRK